MCVVPRAPTVYCMWTTHVLKDTTPLGSKYLIYILLYYIRLIVAAINAIVVDIRLLPVESDEVLLFVHVM